VVIGFKNLLAWFVVYECGTCLIDIVQFNNMHVDFDI